MCNCFLDNSTSILYRFLSVLLRSLSCWPRDASFQNVGYVLVKQVSIRLSFFQSECCFSRNSSHSLTHYSSKIFFYFFFSRQILIRWFWIKGCLSSYKWIYLTTQGLCTLWQLYNYSLWLPISKGWRRFQSFTCDSLIKIPFKYQKFGNEYTNIMNADTIYLERCHKGININFSNFCFLFRNQLFRLIQFKHN